MLIRWKIIPLKDAWGARLLDRQINKSFLKRLSQFLVMGGQCRTEDLTTKRLIHIRLLPVEVSWKLIRLEKVRNAFFNQLMDPDSMFQKGT